MNKQDYYIIGGTVLAVGLFYFLFIYKKKAISGTPYFPASLTGQQQQQNYTGDISADFATGATENGDISGDSAAAPR